MSHFDVLRKNLDAAIKVASLTDEQKRRGTFLYGLLANLLRNRPLMMLKGVDRGNGFEAVRQLFRTCQPSSRNHALGWLHLLMWWPEFDMKVAMLPQILKLEDSFREYERIGGLLSGELGRTLLRALVFGTLFWPHFGVPRQWFYPRERGCCRDQGWRCDFGSRFSWSFGCCISCCLGFFGRYLGCNSVPGQGLDSCVVVWLSFFVAVLVGPFVAVLVVVFLFAFV